MKKKTSDKLGNEKNKAEISSRIKKLKKEEAIVTSLFPHRYVFKKKLWKRAVFFCLYLWYF